MELVATVEPVLVTLLPLKVHPLPIVVGRGAGSVKMATPAEDVIVVCSADGHPGAVTENDQTPCTLVVVTAAPLLLSSTLISAMQVTCRHKARLYRCACTHSQGLPLPHGAPCNCIEAERTERNYTHGVL